MPQQPNAREPSPSSSTPVIVYMILISAVVFGIPAAAAMLINMPPLKGIYLAYCSIHSPILFEVLVWTGCAAWCTSRASSNPTALRRVQLGLIGLCTTAALRGGFDVYQVGARPILVYEVLRGLVFPIAFAVWWLVLLLPIVRLSPAPESVASSDPLESQPLPPRESRLGMLIPLAIVGALLGYGQHAWGDMIAQSPYRSVIYVVGGCILGILIALVMDSMSRNRPSS